MLLLLGMGRKCEGSGRHVEKEEKKEEEEEEEGKRKKIFGGGRGREGRGGRSVKREIFVKNCPLVPLCSFSTVKVFRGCEKRFLYGKGGFLGVRKKNVERLRLI